MLLKKLAFSGTVNCKYNIVWRAVLMITVHYLVRNSQFKRPEKISVFSMNKLLSYIPAMIRADHHYMPTRKICFLSTTYKIV